MAGLEWTQFDGTDEGIVDSTTQLILWQTAGYNVIQTFMNTQEGIKTFMKMIFNLNQEAPVWSPPPSTAEVDPNKQKDNRNVESHNHLRREKYPKSIFSQKFPWVQRG